MSKSPVFLGVYSKILPAGDKSAEAKRRWHVWSLEAGQFLIREVFSDQGAQGEAQRIDSVEFFGNYRVHAAFNAGVKRAAPQAPRAGTSGGLAGEYTQAKSVQDEKLYPMRGSSEKKEESKGATFYAPKDARPEADKTLISDLERLEEQLRSDFSLALIRLQTNRDQAIESLNKIVDNKARFEKKHKFMFSDFGTALRRRKLYSLAFRFHERAKELCPEDEHILFNMARAMFDAGKLDLARNYLRQAVAMAHDFQAGSDFLEFIETKHANRL